MRVPEGMLRVVFKTHLPRTTTMMPGGTTTRTWAGTWIAYSTRPGLFLFNVQLVYLVELYHDLIMYRLKYLCG